jgi:cytochrome c-type biogenesis protein CcmH/NrfF
MGGFWMKFLFYTGFLLFAVTLFGDVAIGQADEEAVPALDVIATADMTLEEQMHFKSIASKLRCPTCTGLSVLDSDAAFSVQIQSLVKEQIKEGKSEDEILAYFTQRYGGCFPFC